jgi:uncharacterized protein YoxC
MTQPRLSRSAADRHPDGAAAAAHTRISLSLPTWGALIAAFLVVTLLLTLTTVTLISQRQKTVLLNKQIAVLLDESTIALHRAEPLLGAVPAHSSTIKSRADTLAHLVSQAGPLVGQLNATGLPSTVAATGQLVNSLQQQGLLTSTLENVGSLAAAANGSGLVNRLGQLVDAVPAASALIAQLGNLASGIEKYRLIPGAARGLGNLQELVRLQTRALRVARATLATGRSTRTIAGQTLATAQSTLGTAQQILTIAEQTLTHAANLDSKVGTVP